MYVGPICKGKFDILVRCTVQSPLTSLVSILNLMTKKGVTKEQYPFTNVACMYQKPKPNYMERRDVIVPYANLFY